MARMTTRYLLNYFKIQTSGNIVVKWFSQSLRVGYSPGREGSFPAIKSCRIFIRNNNSHTQQNYIKESIRKKSGGGKNPEGQSSTINILRLPIHKVHWDVKSIFYILFKPVPANKTCNQLIFENWVTSSQSSQEFSHNIRKVQETKLLQMKNLRSNQPVWSFSTNKKMHYVAFICLWLFIYIISCINNI